MFTVAALYKFTLFDDLNALKPPLEDLCRDNGVKGTILLAHEGINGTIAGPKDGIAAAIDHIRNLPGCADIEWKRSEAPTMPFARMKVRLKREIVTMGQPDVDPTTSVGTYVEAKDWNDLIRSDDVAVIDTRNDYEVAIGSFDGAIDPETKSFSEFTKWWANNGGALQGKKIAMFCTGGIRCEKATNYLIGQGVGDVYHLNGGILKYLEEVPKDDSLWQGECFVFDNRVSVGHGLEPGPYELCHACRRPISASDRDHAVFEDGVSCARCINEFSSDDRDRFRERQRQIALAKARGARHLGTD
jgi:UPF0176 protein